MKKTFFTGIAILLPITITILVLGFLIDTITAPFYGVVEDFLNTFNLIDTAKHKALLTFISRVVALIALVILIFLLGFLGQRFLFKQLFNFIKKALLKIPIVKRIYSITVEVTNSFVGSNEKIFKKTVLVPFPYEESKAYGFQTGEIPREIKEKYADNPVFQDMKPVFVPTSPHPISGFLVMLSERKIDDIDISVEDAFKILLSCGIYEVKKERQPEEKA